MSDINRINLSVLRTYRNDFVNEKENYISSTYATFSNGYISSSSDATVLAMANSLRSIYKDIENCYIKMEKWWDSYINDLEGIENALSNDGRSGLISESQIRNYIYSNLEELPGYLSDFSLVESKKTETFDYAVGAINEAMNDNKLVFNAIGAKISDLTDDVMGKIGKLMTNAKNDLSMTKAEISSKVNVTWNDAKKCWNELIFPELQKKAAEFNDFNNRMNCTVTTATFSLLEGIGQFGEAIVDAGAILMAIFSSIGTGLYDGGQAIYGLATGNEWESQTLELWDKTMGFVSNQYVTGWFDNLYGTKFGNVLKENSYYFDEVRSIGSGIGYVAGVTALTVLTFGVGGAAAGGSAAAGSAATGATAGQMATVAGVAGVGKGTETAWKDGAGLLEGLGAGTLNGMWEGLQFFVGAKIGGSKLFLPNNATPTLKTKFLNSLSKIVLDAADGGVEGIVQPLIQLTYKDGYIDEAGNYVEFSDKNPTAVNLWNNYCELFNDNGGWKAVGTNALVGGGASFLGEIFDIGKFFSDKKKVAGTIENLDTTSTSSTMKPSNNVTIEDIDSQIIAANNRTRKGLTVILTVNNLNDLSLEKLLQIKDPENIYFDILENGKRYDYYQASEMLKEQANLNTMPNAMKSSNDVAIKDIDSQNGVQIDNVAKDLDSTIKSSLNYNSVIEALDDYDSIISSNIKDVFNKKINLMQSFLGVTFSIPAFFSKLKNANVLDNIELTNKIKQEGLLHFTDLASAEKIMSSSYIKSSDAITSYGSKKSYFFGGIPTFEQTAINLNGFEPKRVAIKLDFDETDLIDFQYRDLSDNAISYKGDYHFDSTKASIAYYGLFEENGELVYKELTKAQFDN